MLRSLLASSLILAAAIGTAACGGDEKKPPETPTKPAATTAPGTKPPPSGDQGTPESSGSSGLSGAALQAYTDGWNAWLVGDLATAKKKFQSAQSLDAKSPAPPYSLGIVLERQGDVSGAQQSYRAAYTSAPDHELSMCAYAISLASSGHMGEADSFLQGQRTKRPNSARLTTCAAEVKSVQNDHASAQQLAQDALRMDPDFKDAMVETARDHYRARRIALAEYALTAILVGFAESSPPRDKDNADAHLIRGLIQRESGLARGRPSRLRGRR